MKVEISKIDADLFLKLYTPVGMARLIGDGGMSFYLKGFAVITRPGMMKMIG